MDKSLIMLCKHALEVGVGKGTVNQRFAVVKMQGKPVFKDGEVITTQKYVWDGTTICSAGLRSASRVDWEGLDAIASVTQRKYHGEDEYRDGTLTKEEAMKFYDILINHTPFGACIATADTEEAYELGLIIDTHFPSRLVAGVTMAQRLAWEHTKIAKSIIHFADLGVHKGLAFLLGHMYTKTGFSVSNNWHTCIDSNSISPMYIRNFLMGLYDADKDFNVQKHYSFNIQETWSKGDNKGSGEKLRINIAKHNKDMAKPVEIINPFAKSFKLDVKKQSDLSIVDYFDNKLGSILRG